MHAGALVRDRMLIAEAGNVMPQSLDLMSSTEGLSPEQHACNTRLDGVWRCQ